jgi:hypothetical protein
LSSLLLISNIEEDVTFAAELAKQTGCDFLHAPKVPEGVRLFKNSPPQFLLADGSTAEFYKQLETELHDKVGLFSDLVQANSIHFIAEETMENVPFLTASPLFGSLLYRKFNAAKDAATHYSRVLNATKKDRAYGLENFMRPGTKIQTIQLKSSDTKQAAVSAVTTYLLQAGFQPRMATLISNAVDELLMNAIFDAPVDNAGQPLYAKTARSTVIKLEARGLVEMQVGFDGQYVGITAIDHYGSLDKKKLLEHASKSYSDSNYKGKSNQAGAGLGIATVYQNGGSLFFASCAGDRTEVSIFFKRTNNFIEFKNQFRFFSTQFYF